MYGKKGSLEWPTSDINCDEVIDGFYGLLVLQGYSPKGILSCMEDFIQDRLPNEENED
jgi:hypothetical protein